MIILFLKGVTASRELKQVQLKQSANSSELSGSTEAVLEEKKKGYKKKACEHLLADSELNL